ncbi:lipase maturation factor 1 [Homo sapiens]|uniref:Lipase maturation factor 1 n=1 Tax=Homo sapiens TaxID=9606 RepID=F5H802_HUMAN|nr:lipase maturation factor 1 [Homo sapiens]
MPTILWLMDWSDMNSNLDLLALLGLGISSFVLITGCANMLLMAALWGLYMSLVNVGHVWYSFAAQHVTLDCRAEIQKTRSSFGSALPAFRAAMRL